MSDVRVAVIGAGPAGLSAALWLKNLGFTPVVIEKLSATGGMQNFNFLTNDWVLGQVGATGVDIAKNFDQHIAKENIDLRLNHSIAAIATVDNGFCLAFDVGEGLSVQAIVLASGTRYVDKEILSAGADIDHIDPRYIMEGPHAFLGLEKCSGQHVVIIGAGDNAFENALLLLDQGSRVTMVARSIPKAQTRFLEKVLDHARFSLLEHSTVTHLVEKDNQLMITIGLGGRRLQADRLHILAGYRSNADTLSHLLTSGLGQTLACDGDGFLQVDVGGRTNIASVYAAGDVCNTQFPCVVSAVASGALAAKTISQDFA